MAQEVNLYDGHYGRLTATALSEVRRATYGEDLGQAGWITAADARELFALLGLRSGDSALEVACGSGGVLCRMVTETGVRCVGIDINPHGIAAAKQTAQEQRLGSLASFHVANAAERYPFADASFDGIFCIDSINHFPGRLQVLREWNRLLRPGGRLVYTDPIVVTGQLTDEEMRTRSSIGFFLFTPVGVNEQLLAQSGFEVTKVQDATDAVASISKRWLDARESRRADLAATEGADAFVGLQSFLRTVHALSSERRLSRFVYVAQKARAGGGWYASRR